MACESLFKDNEQLIEINKKAIFPHSSMIDTMMELLETNDSIKPTHLSENIDSTAQQENIEDFKELEETSPIDTSDLPIISDYL